MRRNIFLIFLFIFILLTSGEKHHRRIRDDSEAPPHAYPWIVSLRLSFLNLLKRDCAGVVLSETFILTAASCFRNVTGFTQYFTIKAGIHRIGNVIEPTEQARFMSQLIQHPNSTNHSYLNDLALLRVTPPFRLNRLTVFPIALSNLISMKNRNLTVIGWGGASPGKIPIPLKQAIVKENVQCVQEKLIDSSTQLCASGVCVGDTGGPLMVYSDEREQFELAGITSYRGACMTEGVFTRVAPFIEWIISAMKRPPPLPPPSIIPTFPPSRTTTTSPDPLGPPIPFICNTSYPCGCSSVPVIFHDELPPPPDTNIDPLQIVGGEVAQPHSWSWAVSLRKPSMGHFCGGSLIHNEWVLTAAHCSPSTSTIVHIGVHDEKLPSPETRQVVEVIVHPDFIPPPKFLNDIVLLRISPPMNFTISNAYAGLSCLAPKRTDHHYPKVNTRLAVIGWGKVFSGGPRSTKLRQVRVKTLANHDRRCASSSYDTDRQFCAMVDGGGKDSCQGDSGGPIHQWLDDHWEQVGIVSFGNGCAQANNPGMYTRLSFYHDWIQSYLTGTNETTDTSTAITTEAITTEAITTEAISTEAITTEAIFTSDVININSTLNNQGMNHKINLFFFVIMYMIGRWFFFIF